MNLERFDEAESALTKAFDGASNTLGPDHSIAIMAATNLATLWRATDRIDDAERLLRETIDRARRVHGPEHRATGFVVIELANLLRDFRGPSGANEADELYRAVIAIFENALPPNHPIIDNARAADARLSGVDSSRE